MLEEAVVIAAGLLRIRLTVPFVVGLVACVGEKTTVVVIAAKIVFVAIGTRIGRIGQKGLLITGAEAWEYVERILGHFWAFCRIALVAQGTNGAMTILVLPCRTAM